MENNMKDEYPISEILTEIRFFDGNYKREQVDAAIEQKDEIIPHLIKILENVLSNPREYIQDEHMFDHIYAFMLLGHFKAKDAHKVIVNIFSLKDGIPDALFGDLSTNDLPTILFNTCGGSVDLIKSMILDKEINEYCRISACQALAYAVVTNYVSRKEVVEFLGGMFTGNEADETSDFWGLLASILADLYPEEIIDIIRKGYEDGLIMPGMVEYEHFERMLEIGEENCLDNLRKDLEYRSIDDLHKSMSWWACFKKDSPKSSFGQQIQNQQTQKKKAAAKRKKQKQAKKSRKKNRR